MTTLSRNSTAQEVW